MKDQQLRLLIINFLANELGKVTGADFKAFLKECEGVVL